MSNRSSPISEAPGKSDSNNNTFSPKKNSFSISSILGAVDTSKTSPASDKKDNTQGERANNALVSHLWLPSPREVPKLDDIPKPTLAAQNNFMRGLPWLGNPYLLQSLAHGKLKI